MLANPNALTNDLFDLSMLDAKEKKKLKKKQRKRDKKIKQQMAQHGLLTDENASMDDTDISCQFMNLTNEWNIDFIESIKNNTQYPDQFFDKFQKDLQQSTFQLDKKAQEQKKNKGKKGKSGGKISDSEIHQLSTDELLSYIESEGKKLKQSIDKRSQEETESQIS